METVAFVVLNYNDTETTTTLVDKLCGWKQEKFRMKVIVVDNHSPDGSFAVLQKTYEGQKDVDVIDTGKNGGYSYGNNFGSLFAIKKYHPDYIAITNPDVILEEDMIGQLLQTFSEDERILMCAPVEKSIDGSYQIMPWSLPTYGDDLKACFTELIPNASQLMQMSVSYLNGHSNMILTEAALGSFYVVRSDLFAEIGMLDDGVFLYCEERILGYRIKSHGYIAVLRSDLFYIHHHSVTIKKALKAVQSRRLVLESRCYYERVYNNIGGGKLLLLKGASSLSLALYRVTLFMRPLYRALRGRKS